MTRALRTMVIVVLASSCNGNDKQTDNTYAHFITISASGWSTSEELFFVVPIQDNNKSYSIQAHLRVNPIYKLKVLPIGMVIENPEREIEQRVLMIPTDAKEMNRIGYNISEKTYTIDGAMNFPKAGNYTFSFKHLLKDSLTYGIIELGLLVSPTP